MLRSQSRSDHTKCLANENKGHKEFGKAVQLDMKAYVSCYFIWQWKEMLRGFMNVTLRR